MVELKEIRKDMEQTTISIGLNVIYLWLALSFLFECVLNQDRGMVQVTSAVAGGSILIAAYIIRKDQKK